MYSDEGFGTEIANLSLQVVLPLIIIIGTFLTTRQNKAIIVKKKDLHYYYRFDRVNVNKTEIWRCITDKCSCSITFSDESKTTITKTQPDLG